MRRLALALILVLTAAWPAYAAIAVVQTATCEIQAATDCSTGTITSTTGNLLIAPTGILAFGAVTSGTVSDSKTNTWSSAVTQVLEDSSAVQIDYVASATGGTSHSFTLTLDGVGYGAIGVLEVSGADAVSPLDKTAIGTDSAGCCTTHATNATATTTVSNELLVGVGSSQEFPITLTTDTGAGWTERFNYPTDADSESFIVGTRIVGSTGSYTYTYTSDVASRSAQAISTWKESTTGGGTTPSRMLRGIGR